MSPKTEKQEFTTHRSAAKAAAGHVTSSKCPGEAPRAQTQPQAGRIQFKVQSGVFRDT